MKAITDRIRVVLFGIAVALLGIVNPSKALQVANAVLNREQWVNEEIDSLAK